MHADMVALEQPPNDYGHLFPSQTPYKDLKTPYKYLKVLQKEDMEL